MVEIPVVAVQLFLQSAVPEIDQDEFSKIMDLMGGIRNDGKLMDFGEAPSSSGKNEAGAFCPLKDVFDAIIRCAAKVHPDRRRTLDFKYKPNTIPPSSKDNSSRSDFFFSLVHGDEALKSAGVEGPWEDIPVAGEGKKELNNENKHDAPTICLHLSFPISKFCRAERS